MKIVNDKLKIVEAFLGKVVGIESHSIYFLHFILCIFLFYIIIKITIFHNHKIRICFVFRIHKFSQKADWSGETFKQ